MTVDQMWATYQEKKDVGIRNDLVIHYLDMVQKVVYTIVKGANLWHLSEDFNSVGVIGLIDAINKFDHSKNVSFETYASIRIKGTIRDYMRKQDPLSRSVRDAQKVLELARDTFVEQKNREPSDEELAEAADMPLHKVKETISSITYAETVSFEEEIGENLRLFDVIQSDDPALDTRMESMEITEKLEMAIETLTDREQKVIALYYKEELKQKEIAYVLDVSEGRVCQILKKALSKLKMQINRDF